MRLFVALEVADEIRERIRSLRGSLVVKECSVRWVELQNLHVTLKFLGEVREDRVKDIVKIVQDVASRTRTFAIAYEGMGTFGPASQPRVLWIGVKEGEQQLLQLMGAMEEKLESIRHEERPPTAHLTIGRLRTPDNALLSQITQLRDVKVGEMVVKELKLKQSVLGRSGPAYSDVRVFPLADV